MAQKRTTANGVRVKRSGEVVESLQNFAQHNLHDRYNFRFSKKIQKKLVAYGPWLAGLVILVAIPQLLVLSKTGNLMSVSGFFETILFNQESWVILILLFVNVLLYVDGLSNLFEKQKKGWDRMYFAAVISSLYAIWQLLDGFDQPAAPILALIGFTIIIFSLLDIREYYK